MTRYLGRQTATRKNGIPSAETQISPPKSAPSSTNLLTNDLPSSKAGVRRNQVAGIRIQNLDSRQHKQVLAYYSNKNKSGTTQLHAASKELAPDGTPTIKHAYNPTARTEATKRTLDKQLNAPPGDVFFINDKCDEVGLCGITYNNATFTEEDIPGWCPALAPLLQNASDETKEIVSRVIADHAKLQHNFQEPSQQRKEFKWPFQYDPDKSEYTKGTETYNKLIKMVKGSPSKARHDSLTLHILGRLPKEFFQAYEQLENMILACRYQPTSSADQTMALLIKPNGDPTDRRPISLSTDPAAHWSGRVQDYYANALSKSGVLPEENKAFTKNTAVEETTLEHACAIEDSLQFGALVAEVCDDMEKMYNMMEAKYSSISTTKPPVHTSDTANGLQKTKKTPQSSSDHRNVNPSSNKATASAKGKASPAPSLSSLQQT